MLLKGHNAPYIKSRETGRTVMGDAVIALLPLYFMAFYFYGVRAAMLGLTSVATCVAADVLCVLLRGERPNPRDLSPIVTGLIIPLMMPASISYQLVVVGGIFAIVFVKQPFGGVGQNLFNPAAAAVCLLAITWPGEVFAYPQPLEPLEAFGTVSAKLVEGPAHALKLGGVPVIETLDMLTGNFAGPMGATNVLVLGTCLIYLVFRHTVSWQLPVTFLGTAAALSYLFPRVPVDRFTSMNLEMLSGTIIFAGIFLITDPVTSPKRGLAKYLYGASAAVVTVLFRRYGGYELTAMFAVLLMNAFAPAIDRLSEVILRILRRIRFEPKKRRAHKSRRQAREKKDTAIV